MGGCCGGGPVLVTVEFDYVTVSGSTCERCGHSLEGVRAAVDRASTTLPPSLARVELVERQLPPERFAGSNTVRVNGLPAEEWLGGTACDSDCPSCGDLLGQPTVCREIEVGGVRIESFSDDMVLDAIMAAAGLAPAGVPGLDCCGSGAAASVGSDAASTGGPSARVLSSEDSKEGPDGDAASCCAPAKEPTTVTLVTGPGCG